MASSLSQNPSLPRRWWRTRSSQVADLSQARKILDQDEKNWNKVIARSTAEATDQEGPLPSPAFLWDDNRPKVQDFN